MKSPNKYITIIFILAIIYVAYNLATPSSKKKWGSKPNEAAELSTGALESGNTFKGKSGSEKDTNKKEEQKILPWGKDPFLFPEGMSPYKKKSKNKAIKKPKKRPKVIAKRVEKRLSLKITSILISEGKKVATIDRPPYILIIGDWIEDEQVLEILPDRIILGKNGKKQEILLKAQSKSSKN